MKCPQMKAALAAIALASLERRMRGRWQTISRLWEENKARATKLNLLRQLDYYGKLSSQLDWQHDDGGRPIRILQSEAGQPTAALIRGDAELVDETLYWITCKDTAEAYYLLAIINSNALRDAVAPLMPKGQFGARHLHKHLWQLPIPEYDPNNALHADISNAGKSASEGATRELARLRAERKATRRVFSVTVARRELRGWLRSAPEGKRVEEAVGSCWHSERDGGCVCRLRMVECVNA